MKSNLRDLMSEKKMTIRSLEAKSQISNVTILKARSDEKIIKCTLETLSRIAAALGVRVRDLFDEDDPGTD